METRVALLSIIVHDPSHVDTLNALLHEYGPFIIGRMGTALPGKGHSYYQHCQEAPQDKISALAGKIGKIPGITSRATYANMGEKKS